MFCTTGDKEKDEKIDAQRKANLAKILQTIEVKMQIRDNEIKEADLELEQEGVEKQRKSSHETHNKAEASGGKIDAFFKEVAPDAED